MARRKPVATASLIDLVSDVGGVLLNKKHKSYYKLVDGAVMVGVIGGDGSLGEELRHLAASDDAAVSDVLELMSSRRGA